VLAVDAHAEAEAQDFPFLFGKRGEGPLQLRAPILLQQGASGAVCVMDERRGESRCPR
jgi:hypothetical protein